MTTEHIDTTKVISIEKSVSKLVLVIVGCLAFILIAWWMIVSPLASEKRASAPFWGWIALIFFGLCLIAALWRIFILPRVVVTLSAQGLRDLRLSRAEIPWGAVHDVQVIRVHSQKFVGLVLAPGTVLPFSPFAELIKKLNKGWGCDITLSSNDLKLCFAELNDLVHAYWRAHGSGKINDGQSPTAEIRGA